MQIMAQQRYDVSLSTMWARDNFPSLGPFFMASGQLGFAKIELNHQVNSVMLAGIDLSQFQFSSIHEPCPADIPVDTLKQRDWLVSAQDEAHRQRGVESVKRSIDLAHELGVKAIVVHAGNVHADLTLEKKLRTFFEAGKSQTEEYQTGKAEMLQDRANLAGIRLEAVKKSLLELLEYAARFNIILGLENRYHYLDIPTPDEMGILLDLAGPDQLGFVYDVGHAQVMERLGFFSHDDWLQRFASRIVGVHLHDVMGVRDHYVPGLGEVDFKRVAACLPQTAFRTCELKPASTAEQIRTGLEFLVDQGCVGSLFDHHSEM
jgi:sugar phosphate isomerase/epimerase